MIEALLMDMSYNGLIAEVTRIIKAKSACPIKTVVRPKIEDIENLYKIRRCQIHHMADGTVIPE